MGFQFSDNWEQKHEKVLRALAKKSRMDAMRMIQAAGAGHIGGSFSSADIYAVLWGCKDEDDRVVISHGHTSAAVYAVLGNLGYFDVEEAVEKFRRGGIYEGHPGLGVKGITWCSGALGQGLSVGCGLALAKKMRKRPGRIFTVMGDGEQQKGQLQEAREFAAQHHLDNLVAVIDSNGVQSTGRVGAITGQDIVGKYEASGWECVCVDGHDCRALFEAFKDARGPLAVFAKTRMGKGLACIEDDYRYHGTVIDCGQYGQGLLEFALSEEERRLVRGYHNEQPAARQGAHCVRAGARKVYPAKEKVDLRTAFGSALADMAKVNPEVPMAVFDCDLSSSVKLDYFKEIRPEALVQCGIAEQNACTAAAASSKEGMLAVWAGFSMFALIECYAQHRTADINRAGFKTFCTHAGLDVGEDGKTHQSTEYLSLAGNLRNQKIVIPADANQADAVTRWALQEEGATMVIMGRSAQPVLQTESSDIRFGGEYVFEYGKADWLREGADGCIVTMGNMAGMAVEAADTMKAKGIRLGVLNISCPFALDEEKLQKAAKAGYMLIWEDHNAHSGIGSLLARYYMEKKISCRLDIFGVTEYGKSDGVLQNYRAQGIDPQSIQEHLCQQYNLK